MLNKVIDAVREASNNDPVMGVTLSMNVAIRLVRQANMSKAQFLDGAAKQWDLIARDITPSPT